MHKYLGTLFFILVHVSCFGQKASYLWQDSVVGVFTGFEFLVDQEYSFKEVSEDSTRIFAPYPAGYKPKTENYWWFRFSVHNPSEYTKEGYLALVPDINNVLYMAAGKKWTISQAGLGVLDFKRKKGTFPILLPSQKTTTFYAKVKVNDLQGQAYAVAPKLFFYPKKIHEKNEQFINFSLGATALAMLLFFLYNLYIYFVFKDRAQVYYLVIVVGGILYLSSFSGFFDTVLPFNFYGVQAHSSGLLYGYGANEVLGIVAVWFLFFGFLQFTRSYLGLKDILPFWDQVLKYVLFLLSLSCLVIVCMSFVEGNTIYFTTALPLNVFLGFIMLLLVGLGVGAYQKVPKLATYYLIANSLPFVMVAFIAFYVAIYAYAAATIRLLPHITLLAQTLTFAVALAARINLLKDELKEKQLYAKELEKENQSIEERNQYIELENEYIMAEMAQEIHQKKSLQEKLEANQRELTANTLYLYQKNKLLANLQKQIQDLSYKEISERNKKGLREIKSSLKNDVRLESDWENFKIHFESVHPNFFKDLRTQYPKLTPNEIRLSAYFHLNMSAKEIAALLNINPASVHRAKSRLNKKKKLTDQEKGN